MRCFIHCGVLSLFLFIFNFSLLGCPLFYSTSVASSPSRYLYLLSCYIFFLNLHFLFICFPLLPNLPFFLPYHQTCCCVTPFVPSFTFNLRLSQFQMSWLQSCWVTRQTLAPWSLWSLGGASSTGQSASVYPCPRPGRRARETLGRATPPVCVCFALS